MLMGFLSYVLGSGSSTQNKRSKKRARCWCRTFWYRCGSGRTHIERVWMDGNGDCRQELVLIGRDMDPQALTLMLDECLLTEEELSTNEQTWNLDFIDPFPEWNVVADE